MNWLDLLGWKEDDIESLRFVAFSYLKQGKYDVALIFFEALLIIVPNTLYDLQTIGALYLQLGKSLKALSFLDQALKIDPQHPPTLLNRAKALFSLGYKKQAIAQIEKLLTTNDPQIRDQATALMSCYS